jgi:hypothetical protein
MNRSVIPECGDQRWRTHKGPALALFGSLAVDALLVIAVVVWVS